MIRVFIPYGTTEGQTARISEYLADVIRDHGHEAYAVDIKGSGAPEPDDYDAAIVGASIHMGKHEDYVRDFVRENRDALERLPSAFFSVSLAATTTPRKQKATSRSSYRRRAGVPAWSVSSAALCST